MTEIMVTTARRDTPGMEQQVGPFPSQSTAQKWAERYEAEAGSEFVAVVGERP